MGSGDRTAGRRPRRNRGGTQSEARSARPRWRPTRSRGQRSAEEPRDRAGPGGGAADAELQVDVREVALDGPRAERQRRRRSRRSSAPSAQSRRTSSSRGDSAAIGPASSAPARAVGPARGTPSPRRRTSPRPARRRAGCGCGCRARRGASRGSRDETSTALSNVVDRSPVAWRMSVGAVIRWRSSAMSTGLAADPARDGVLRRGRHPLEVVEPAHLLLGRVRDEARREDPAEDRILLGPADPDHAPVGLLLGQAVAVADDRHRRRPCRTGSSRVTRSGWAIA